MSEWTDSAKKVWDEYVRQTTAALDGTGAEPQEVLDDLRRHVDEETAAAKLGVVTGDDLQKILAKIGPPTVPKSETYTPTNANSAEEPVFDARPWMLRGVLLFLGVIMPIVTISFEWFTGISADVLFDPIPTWFHVFIVLTVPVGNFWLWIAMRRKRPGHETWLGWLNGFVLGVCIYYSFLYIMISPYACMGVIWFGLGLIPLTPYLALIATPLLRLKYCRAMGLKKLPGHVRGALVALLCLLCLQLPETLTYYGLSRAASDDPGTSDYGIKVLRFCGNRTTLLRACYGWLQYREVLQPINMLAIDGSRQNLDSDTARQIFYRVTGEAFNAVPPPKFYTRAGAWTELDDEYTWDDGLGGDQVAGRIKGLSLLSSRMDTTTEPDAGIAYSQWTLEFKNVSAMQREARTEIALPPGAVVSRATLCIDGEEREAAFGGRSQTRTAYKEEAVEHHHDPLLITTCGPDRVLVQCFPIQPNGGVMKIRLGITTPLVLDSLSSGTFVWPYFLERNFNIATGFKHSLWLEQPGADNQMVGTHEDLLETNLSMTVHTTLIHRHAEDGAVWTAAETPGQIIRQTIEPLKISPPGRIVIVLDASAGMKQFLPEIASETAQMPASTEVAVVVASDRSEPAIGDVRQATADNLADLQKKLRRIKCSGGQDNLPALETGWDLADAADSGAVVWIHLPEPFELSSDSGICQRLERNLKHTRFYEIQLRSGPDRIVEKLDGLPFIEHVLAMSPAQSGLGQLLNEWSGHAQKFEYIRQLTNDTARLPSDIGVSKHIERLWARDEALRLARNRQATEAIKLAAQNQLVTPFTGAVVLETKAQYDHHGLSPADPNTVPDIPEPQNLTILAIIIVACLLIRKRRLQSRRNE